MVKQVALPLALHYMVYTTGHQLVASQYLQTALNDLQDLLVSIYEAQLVRISTDESTVVLGWSLRIA